jgi:hypothetical protein
MHSVILAASVALMFFAPCVVAMRGDPDADDGGARWSDPNQPARENDLHGDGKQRSAKKPSHA